MRGGDVADVSSVVHLQSESESVAESQWARAPCGLGAAVAAIDFHAIGIGKCVQDAGVGGDVVLEELRPRRVELCFVEVDVGAVRAALLGQRVSYGSSGDGSGEGDGALGY